MKPDVIMMILALALGAGQAALGQETNASAAPARISLQTVMQKNIFDPTRSGGRVRGGPARRAAIVRSFTFRGTIGDGDVALFTGDGAAKGYLRVGKMINGFKVMKIPVSYTDPVVILTDPSGTIVKLKEGESMRREEDGPWTKSDRSAPAVVASAEPKGEEASATPSAGPAGESDILRKLRLKREQEDK